MNPVIHYTTCENSERQNSRDLYQSPTLALDRGDGVNGPGNTALVVNDEYLRLIRTSAFILGAVVVNF